MNKQFMMDRLQEPSTWKGLTLVAGLFGYAATPEEVEVIAGAATAVIALINIFTKERK